jgi:hypothetical protein
MALTGCGSAASEPPLKLPPDERPVQVGRGPAFRLRALSAAVARGAPIASLRCTATHAPSFGVHLELYAHRLVLPLPAGIGVAAPQRRRGAYVLGGRCTYPIRTFEPTGVIVVDGGRALTLGALFDVWGQPLGRDALAGFRDPVAAFVGGRRWRGRLQAIALRRHAEIVLEVAGAVLPHPEYHFPPGV